MNELWQKKCWSEKMLSYNWTNGVHQFTFKIFIETFLKYLPQHGKKNHDTSYFSWKFGDIFI